MRFRALWWLAFACGFCRFASSADLSKEDLRSVEETFRKVDASLDRFQASGKQPIGADRSVMVVQAAPTEERSVGVPVRLARIPIIEKTKIGVFVVSGPSNRVQSTLDLLSPNDGQGFPEIDEAGANSVSLEFTDGSYGLYYGSIRYFFDPAGGKPVRKVRYGRLALTSSSIRNGSLIYTASSSGWNKRHVRLTIDPRDGGLPGYRIADLPAPPDTAPLPVVLHLSDGTTVETIGTPPGQSHRPAGFAVIDRSGRREVFLAPVPTMEQYRKLRVSDQAPAEIENDIGAAAIDGSTVWFANSFYDGEGVSGVGAIGAFDVRTHRFDMRYLPDIVRWSGSTIRLDGKDIWVGMARQPEGAAFSGGLLRYNRGTGFTTVYRIPEIVNTIDRLENTIYCGTSNGLCMIRREEITQMRFEPDADGRTVMVAKKVSPK